MWQRPMYYCFSVHFQGETSYSTLALHTTHGTGQRPLGTVLSFGRGFEEVMGHSGRWLGKSAPAAGKCRNVTKQNGSLAGHSALSQVQLTGTATTQASGDAMAEDHLSFLPHLHHPFLSLVTWSRYTRVSKEDEAQGNRNENVFFF